MAVIDEKTIRFPAPPTNPALLYCHKTFTLQLTKHAAGSLVIPAELSIEDFKLLELQINNAMDIIRQVCISQDTTK